MPVAWKQNTGIPSAFFFFWRLTCCSFPSCCEPPVQIESCKCLKLVRNLRGIIVQAIRVIDCLDTLSGCIISHWLRPGLGRRPGAKWLKSKRNQACGEWVKPVMYDKIQQFHCTWKSSGASRKKILYKYVQKVEGLKGIWFRMMEWAICKMTVYDGFFVAEWYLS